GWVAGRGPLFAAEAGAATSPAPPLSQVRPELPARGRPLRLAIAAAAGVAVFAILASVAVSQPWRSERKGGDAIALAAKHYFFNDTATTEKAEDLDPLSIDPYLDR